MIARIKRLYHWIRIKCLELFTKRVNRFEVTDQEGKKHDVIVEQDKEKVCDHKTITEIAPTMWKCSNPKCPTYFQVNYKVMLTKNDLLTYLEQIADHLKLKIDE